mgnify:CR=1 FL=1
MKNIIITGVTGQDGSHMADYLLKNTDYKLYGAVRRLSVKNHENILHLQDVERFDLINMDLTDAHSIRDVILQHKPDYFINFAAQSFVAGSWEYPVQTWNTDANAVLDILESLRRFAPECRFYNAGSSEEFGDVIESPQTENSPLRPRSPYGAAKCAARHLVKVYRDSYDLFAIQGWLFNHEGTRRGLDFVTRKITHGVALLKRALETNAPIPLLKLGNLEAQRDWADAEDMMSGIWKMLNNKDPQEYILSTGEMHTIREFLEETLKVAGIELRSSGSGKDEKFYTLGGELFLEIDPAFYRPAEVHELCGDPTRAQEELGWHRQTSFPELVGKMYRHDYGLLS